MVREPPAVGATGGSCARWVLRKGFWFRGAFGSFGRPLRSFAGTKPLRGRGRSVVVKRTQAARPGCNRMQPRAPVCNLMRHGATAGARNEAMAPNEATAG